MRRIIFIIFSLYICSSIYGQTKLAVNPGLKFGLAFGEKVEFVFGYELSFVLYDLGQKDEQLCGLVLNYDTIGNLKRFHIGFEYIYRVVGLDVGPTFVWDGTQRYDGFSIIPFSGLLLFPYYNFTNLKGYDDIHEIGSYLKIPIPLSGENLKLQ